MAFRKPLAATQIVEQQPKFSPVQQQQLQPPVPAKPVAKTGFGGRQPAPQKSAPPVKPQCCDVEIKERETARLEATVTGNLKSPVEWYKDNNRLKESGKYKFTSTQNGVHTLFLNNVVLEDAGIYKCLVPTASSGNLENFWNVIVKPAQPAKKVQIREQQPKGQLQQQSVTTVPFLRQAGARVQEESFGAPNVELARLKQVQRQQAAKTAFREQQNLNLVAPSQPPQFGTPLKDPGGLIEGQTATFQCNLSPANDSTMKIVWLFKGKPVQQSSRVSITFLNGVSTLEIQKVTRADSGTYTCMVVNQLGQNQSTASLTVEGRQAEASFTNGATSDQKRRKIDLFGPEPPNFSSEFRNIETFEGKPVRFEAKLTPMNDSQLKIDWFFNGQPITVGSRIRTTHNFGYAIIDILQASQQDSGTYTCRATNSLGTVETNGVLFVQGVSVAAPGAQWVDQNEWGSDEVAVHPAPHFTTPLQNRSADEGGRCYFEARLTPTNDPHLKIEWFKDGVPLQMANRIQVQHSFGYISLGITSVYPEDSGTYTCVATNRVGQDHSQAQLECQSKESLILKSQHQSALAPIQKLDSYQVHIGPVQEDRPEEMYSLQQPNFTTQLPQSLTANQEQRVYMECRVQPANDPKVKVEWYKNGEPLAAGHKMKTSYDFGRAILDILYAYPEDSGIYSAVATNDIGQDVTECELQVSSEKTLYLDPQHPEGLQRIKELEAERQIQPEQERDLCEGAPKIIGQLSDQHLKEGTNLHLSFQVQPVNDPTMHVDWYLNRQPLVNGSRFVMKHELGHVLLFIKSLIAEDSGEYIAHVYNDKGETQATCQVTVESDATIKTDTHHGTSLKRIEELESMDRYGRKEILEKQAEGPPKFVQNFVSESFNFEEDQSLHLETKVEPSYDNSLVIEWYHGDNPVQTGHRFRTFQDFGFVSFDISSLLPEDSGTYTCYARNSHGEAYIQCEVQCQAKSSIILKTDHPSSVKRITELEAPKVAPEEAPVGPKPQPTITQALNDISDIQEGQSVHLQCGFAPKDDNKLKIFWYHNGNLLSNGHRFQTGTDFGFASLNILYAYPEDTGTYICLVKNESGQAQSQCQLSIKGLKNMQLDPNRPESWQKIQELEAPRLAAPEEPSAPKQAPKFLAGPQNHDDLIEGQPCHLECQVEPIDDPNLKIEWYQNGKLLTAGHRFKHVNEFGYVSFDFVNVYPEDAGTYTCKAINSAGSAEAQCTIKCQPRSGLILDPNNPESWTKIKQMEEAKPAQPTELLTDYGKPHFASNLQGPTEILKEGQSIHLECQAMPNNDPNLKAEWFFNGKPLAQASRFKLTNDFGLISMDLQYVNPEDTGIYTVKISNAAGDAETSFKIECKALRSLYLDSQHLESWQKIQEIENREQVRPPSPEMHFPKPTFTQALQNFDEVAEASPIRLECRVQPPGDPTLKIQWLLNGQVIAQASRFRPTHDFDIASLDILTLYPEDSGVYSCRAVSEFGEAVTSCTVKCLPKDSLLLDTQHEQSWVKIQEIENRPAPEPLVEKLQICAPRFLNGLQDQPSSVNEGQPVHFECQIEPANDPNLQVHWFHNGEPLVSGHRFRTTHDFNYVALDILYAFPEDSGTWTCYLVNSLGEADSSGNCEIQGRRAIVADVQHPQSWQRIQEIEAPKLAPEPAAELAHGAPKFTQKLDPTSIQRLEGQPVHFECRLTPLSDPNLKVEWYQGDKLLHMGNRFKPTIDFGFVSLDIAYVHPEDSGVYTVRAVNQAGEDYCQAELTVTPKSGIISDTQHPSSLAKIQQLEAGPEQAPALPEPERGAPKFTVALKNVADLIEGQPAHFEATIEPVNDPNLRIEWYHNGQLIQAGSRIKVYHEFGLVALDLVYCLPEDAGSYTCRAINKQGQMECSADLQCKGRNAILGDTLHEKSLAKIQIIEAPKVAPEPAEAVILQKPTFTESLSSVDNLPEGEPCRFQCRLIPVNDPKMKIQWYFNEKPLALSNRVAMLNDFGQIMLIFASTFAHDSGVYACRAVNGLGEAVTTASLTLVSKASLYLDPQHPESLKQVQILEALDKFPRVEIPDKVFGQPIIKQQLPSLDNIKEGDLVRFECHVEPTNDPSLKIEWLHNDQPVKQANRHKYTKDFGVLSLEIKSVIPEDSGIYTCRVKNQHGTAVTSGVLKVEGYEAIMRNTQHPISWEKIQDLERPVVQEVIETPDEKVKPFIVQQLQNLDQVPEGEFVILEALYQPARDNSIRAEWTHNGVPIIAGQLVRTKCELGQATLEILNAYAPHSGVYTLTIRNSEGDVTSSCTLKVLGKGPVMGDVQHENSWQRIQELEAPKPEAPTVPDKVYAQPSFIKHLNDVEVAEGEPSSFNCQFEPTGDNSVRVQWFLNGQPLSTGSKYGTNVDFGVASLDILYTFPEDSGVFTCRVENKQGQASTSATLKCQPKEALLLDSLNPASVAAVAILEAPKGRAPELPDRPKQTPSFGIQLPDLGDLYEGQSAHFETYYEPLDDNTLKIKWLHNGQPVEASSRLKLVQDFGFVILDISSVDPRDSGEWVCVATSATGEARTVGRLNYVPLETIVYDPQQPQSLSRIQQLEQPKVLPEQPAAKAKAAPKFVTQLAQQPEFSEGASVHFEAKVQPADDSKMQIRWYKDGQLLQYGHRFRPINDFGFCILDVSYLTAEDSGQYTCVAENQAGSDQTSTTINCTPKAGLILDPQAPGQKARAIAELEQGLRKGPEVVEGPTLQKQAPIFVVPLQNAPDVQEGGTAYFSARVTPTADNEMKIQWFLNGQPITTGSRVKTINDFGYSILQINPVYPEDSGEYVCKAKNAVGEAVTKASLLCTPKTSIVVDTQLPAKMSGAKKRIAELEKPKLAEADRPDRRYGPPKFKSQLQDLNDLVESQVAHFECQLDPIADPTLKIEWFHNDEPIFHSSRIKMINEFGFVILEISPAEPHDSGVYKCKATNRDGTDSVQANIKVEGRSGISYDWQQPQKKDKIIELDDFLNNPPMPPVPPEKEFDAPTVVEGLKDLGEFMEGDSCHFQAKIEPMGDPSIRINWFHNGVLIPYSSRIQSRHDFGFANLDIKHLIPEDSGDYVCQVVNSKGQVQTQGRLSCKSKYEVEPPQFTTPLAAQILDAQEGDDVHMECRFSPLTDPKLQIFWYFNGKPLLNASRFKMVYDFGYVSLDVKGAIAEDSGRYTCRAVNEKGESTTECNLTVKPRPKMIFQRQAPSQTAEDLERHFRQYTEMPIQLKVEDFYTDSQQQAPKFRAPVKNVAVTEGDFARLECQLAPINDPNLKVEWFHNGQPVCVGHRFLPIHDFGYVALVLLYALPEDTGEYQAKATNLCGSDVTQASLVCAATKSVVTDSQRPQGMSIAAISRQEDQLYWTQALEQEEMPRVKQKPVFTIPPRRVQVYENEPARFECAVAGYPKPKVSWYINGRQVVAGQRYKLSYDGMHYLIIPQVRSQDAGDVVCVAKNAEGEISLLVNLDVYIADDFRSHKLRSAYQLSPEEMTLREEQWRQDTLGSLGQAFQQAPRADLPKLMKIEMTKQPIEPMESEELKGKFDQKRQDTFFNKIFTAEKDRPPITQFVVQPIQLKPGVVVKRDLPKEELAKVDLKKAEKKEKPESFGLQAAPWTDEASAKIGATKEGDPKYKMKPAPAKELEVAAKDQVALKTTKPKGSEQPSQFEHVKIAEKASNVQTPAQKPAQPKEVFLPAADQVSLKLAFKPKDGAAGPLTKLEEVALKPATIVTKVEDKKDDKMFQKTPAPQQKSVKQAPVFSKQLNPLKIEVGRSLKLECQFGGDQPVQVTWIKDGVQLVASFEYQIKTGPSYSILEIGKAKTDHAGSYLVRIQNVAGQAESTANVLIGQKTDLAIAPTFQQILSDMKATQGNPARFDIKISGRPQSVTWFKDGKQIIADQRVQILIEQDTYSLMISEALPQDSGLYECVARNSKGEARCKGSLQVPLSKPAPGQGFKKDQPQAQAQSAPKILEPPKMITVQEGGPAKFSVKLSSSPAPTLKWFQNNMEIKSNSVVTISSNPAENLYVLEFKQAFKEDEGEYRCEAVNKLGKTSCSAALKVTPNPKLSKAGQNQAPKFSYQAADQTVKVGDVAKFTVEFSGRPPPTISWLFNNQAVQLSNIIAITNTPTSSVLTIAKVASTNFGKYSCRLNNTAGQVEQQMALKPVAPQKR